MHQNHPNRWRPSPSAPRRCEFEVHPRKTLSVRRFVRVPETTKVAVVGRDRLEFAGMAMVNGGDGSTLELSRQGVLMGYEGNALPPSQPPQRRPSRE